MSELEFERWLGDDLAEEYRQWKLTLTPEPPTPAEVLLRETLRRGRTHPLADPTPWRSRGGIWAQW